MLQTPAATARSLVEAALDDQPPERVTGLPAELDAITAAMVGERVSDVYPTASEMIEVVLTPDAGALGTGTFAADPSGAETSDADTDEVVCVIDSIEAVESCELP